MFLLCYFWVCWALWVFPQGATLVSSLHMAWYMALYRRQLQIRILTDILILTIAEVILELYNCLNHSSMNPISLKLWNSLNWLHSLTLNVLWVAQDTVHNNGELKLELVQEWAQNLCMVVNNQVMMKRLHSMRDSRFCWKNDCKL